MTQPLVSVVVPARNAEATIGEALEALVAQHASVPFEVVVVDNASSDRTADVVDSWSRTCPRVRRVQCDRPGVNAARNLGARVARGALILCCDADDVVAPGWLAAMVEALESFELCGGLLEVERLNSGPVASTRGNLVECSLPVANGLPYALGASLGFRRDVFDAIGGFDEDFRYGADDVDFCSRAQDRGFRIGLASGALTYYRFRTDVRAYFVQYMRYEMGAAQLTAKRVASGHLARIAPSAQMRTLARQCCASLRVDRLVRRNERWAYVRRVAVFVGSVRAVATYHTIPDPN